MERKVNYRLSLLACCAASVFFAAFLSCSPKRVYNEGINVIPAPVSVEERSGTFKLADGMTIVAENGEPAEVAEFYAARLMRSTGYEIGVSDRVPRNGDIVLRLLDDGSVQPEGYILEVSADGIIVTAGDRSGLFYGMGTLMQLLPAEIESTARVKGIRWSVPCVRIEDYPRFGYRGIMQDPCRHFITVDDIKKHLDVMAMYKLNVMHLHLTEDQGWRMEIRKYPELTEIGGRRIEGEGTVHEGYYTQEELKDIVEYARQRCITVIPEIEFPGHALAAMAAFPELSCSGLPTTPRIIWGVEDVVMCAGKESTFRFAEDVLREVAEIFPSEYIHIGGDECPKGEWEKCPLCQRRIDQEGLRYGNDGFTPEQRLQSYFIGRIEGIVEKLGRRIIGWDEILEGGLPESATVMSWRGLYGGIEAASQGHDVVMSPSSDGMYLNFYQGDPKVEPVGIGGDYPLESVYAYDPVPDTLRKMGKEHHILGVQGNCWSEYMYTEADRENFIYPKVMAVAEVGWSPAERKDFGDFCRRLDNTYVRLDAYGINYHIPLPEQPGGSCNTVAFVDTVSVAFTSTRPVRMLYTLDPDGQPDKEYTGPIVLDGDGTIRICSVLPSGKRSETRTVRMVKQEYAPASDIDTVSLGHGLEVRVTDGTFLDRAALDSAEAEWRSLEVSSLRDLTSIVPSDNAMRDFPQYAALASGYVMIPEDGIYYFSSNYNDVSIDGRMLIDNDGKVKKFSHSDCAVALAKGLHSIDVTFLGHITGGWPSNWDSGDIMFRKKEWTEFIPVGSGMLWH